MPVTPVTPVAPPAYPDVAPVWPVAQPEPAPAPPARALPEPVTPTPALFVPAQTLPTQTLPAQTPPPAVGFYGQPPAPTRRSKAPIAILVALLIVALVAAAAWYFLLRGKTPSPSATNGPSATQSSDVNGVKTATRLVSPGSCFEIAQTESSSPAYGYAWVVPCTEPHDSEVFYNQPLPETTYPTDLQWGDLAAQQCDPAFKTYVGSDMNTSRLNVQYIRPTSQSWDAGNTQLICFTVDPSGDRTTSVAGSGE